MSKYSQTEHFQGWWRRPVVLYRGEEIIDQGTIQEIAERRGIRKDTVYWMTMPTAERRKAKHKHQDRVLRVVAV